MLPWHSFLFTETFFVRERACFDDVNQNEIHWLISSFVMSQRKAFSRNANSRSLQTRFCKEGIFLAKSFKMGTAWSCYIEKRKEKKGLKRCVYFFKIGYFIGFLFKKRSCFLSAMKLKLTRNAIDYNFAKLFLCSYANPMEEQNLNYEFS